MERAHLLPINTSICWRRQASNSICLSIDSLLQLLWPIPLNPDWNKEARSKAIVWGLRHIKNESWQLTTHHDFYFAPNKRISFCLDCCIYFCHGLLKKILWQSKVFVSREKESDILRALIGLCIYIYLRFVGMVLWKILPPQHTFQLSLPIKTLIRWTRTHQIQARKWGSQGCGESRDCC